MNDYSGYILKLKSIISDYHQALLKRNYTDAYMIACDITELAQEMEDLSQKMAQEYGNQGRKETV